MYGRDEAFDHTDSEEETTPNISTDISVVKKYSVTPQPKDYNPLPQDEINTGEITSSDSSTEETVTKRKRKRRNRENTDKCMEEKSSINITDNILTKNQKRKLKKKRRKEKQKMHQKSTLFSFAATSEEQNIDIAKVQQCSKDLINFFDAVWDVYQLQEKKKSSERQHLFVQLNECLKCTDLQNKEQIKQLNNIHRIKQLIILRDFKAVEEGIGVLKSDRDSLISQDVCDLMITLFEYWIKDISDKG